MRFYSVLIQVCSGTEVFVKLLEVRAGRAVWHFILLTVLLSLILSLGFSCIYTPKIESICNGLFAQTGDLQFTADKGVRTLKTPEQKKSYLLDDNLCFDYFPGRTMPKDFLQQRSVSLGIVCMDKGFLFWTKSRGSAGQNKYMIFPMQLDLRERQSARMCTECSMEDVISCLQDDFILQQKQKLVIPEKSLSASDVIYLLKSILCLSVLFGALFGIIFISGGSILFLAVFQSLWTVFRDRKLSFRQNFVILIYTAFPALIISALYSLFALPYLQPQSVFLFIFFIYSIFVFRRVGMAINPPQRPAPGDDE